jgi:hypothetical protein
MAKSHPKQKIRARVRLEARARGGDLANLGLSSKGVGIDQRDFSVCSDLSGDTAVNNRELDAIARLLGDELEKLLSGKD